MFALVTGAAGFIGSTVVDQLLAGGHRVRGVDAFVPFYAEAAKRANLAGAAGGPGFELVEADLRSADLGPLLAEVDVVLHLAAQPGVRHSWTAFDDHLTHNVAVTQRLLEACRGRDVERFVLASSSSVYGSVPDRPTPEDHPCAPRSPYGVTKLAAEQLCLAHTEAYGVPTAVLRYFTVYGPRQRPDMALHRLVAAGLAGTAFPMYGDGEQVRELTYVGDVARATLLAATRPLEPGTVLNVAGGSSARLLDLVALVGDVLGRPVEIDRRPAATGDVTRTGGATERARTALGWVPDVDLAAGVAAQVDWHRSRVGRAA